jgi:carbon-monoxide dehydrogenase medium subunit
VAVALGASMVARSVRGTRVIPADEFFAGIMTTNLAEDELLAAVRLPLLPADTRCGFNEFSRRAGDFAMAMAVTLYRLDGGRITEPRIVVGGAEERPHRMVSAEAALTGRAPGEEAFKVAADAAAEAVDPLEDIMTSAEYRRDLVRAVTRRALDQSLA